MPQVNVDLTRMGHLDFNFKVKVAYLNNGVVILTLSKLRGKFSIMPNLDEEMLPAHNEHRLGTSTSFLTINIDITTINNRLRVISRVKKIRRAGNVTEVISNDSHTSWFL